MLRRCLIGLFIGWMALNVAAAAEGIAIKGSNTFGEELGPRLIAAYRQAHPGVTISLESKGTASGIAALLASGCDVASSSRYATEDELRLARSRGLKLKSTLIGFYGVAVVVNPANPVADLTDAQVRDIFTGVVTDWKTIGGGAGAINVIIRDQTAGTHLGFQELAMERRPYAGSARTLSADSDILAAVKRDPNAIGFVSMEVAGLASAKAVRINRIPANAARINNGDYPYSRGLRLYTVPGRTSKAAEAFVGFVLSRRGQAELENAGFVGIYDHTIPSFEW